MKLVECNEPVTMQNICLPLATTPSDADFTKPKLLYNLDNSMEKILRMKNVSDREKWNLYSRSLEKYLNHVKLVNKSRTVSKPNEVRPNIDYESPEEIEDDYTPSITASAPDLTLVNDSDDEYISFSTPTISTPARASGHIERVKLRKNRRAPVVKSLKDILEASRNKPQTRRVKKDDRTRKLFNIRKCYVSLDKWHETSLSS